MCQNVIFILYFWNFCKLVAHSKSYAFSKNLLYSDAVPSSGLNVQKRVLTQLECARLCGQEVTCQTFFYKPLGGVCSLYNHPLLEYTPVIFEEGVEIYTMKGLLLVRKHFFYQIFLEIRNKILWIPLIFINLTNVTYLLEHQFFDFKKIKTRGTCFYLILSLDR